MDALNPPFLEHTLKLDRLPVGSLKALDLAVTIERFLRLPGCEPGVGDMTDADHAIAATFQEILLRLADLWDRG